MITIKKKFCIIGIIFVIFILILKFVVFDIIIPKRNWEHNRIKTKWGDKIKSGDLAPDYKEELVLEDIKSMNLNTINVPILIDVKNLSSNEMQINEDSEKKAIKLIKKLKKMGINVIVEAYPYIKNGEEYETKWKPTNIDKWFWNWKTNVIKRIVDEVAIPYKVYCLNVASNFVNMEYATGYWIDIINYVRKNFKGLVTYKTNFWYTADWDEQKKQEYLKKLNNPLFGKVDFISFAAYFELDDKDMLSEEELTKDIYSSDIHKRRQNIYKEIRNFHQKWNKPIFFGELGFPRKNKAAAAPWNPIVTNIPNQTEQAKCFKAYENVFEKQPWFLGFSVFAIGENGKDKQYYPSKETKIIIKNWFENIRIKGK